MNLCTYTCDDQRVGRPATGKTPVRTLRAPDEVWDPALERAQADGGTLTDVIASFLRAYNALPEDTYRAALARAEAEGRTLAEVMAGCVQRYAARPPSTRRS